MTPNSGPRGGGGGGGGGGISGRWHRKGAVLAEVCVYVDEAMREVQGDPAGKI